MSDIIDINNIDLENMNNIVITNFSVSKEKKTLQREIITQAIINNQKCLSSDIKFLDSHNFEFDDIILFNGKKINVEYKMDYRTYKTGNMVFELIPYINSGFISSFRYSRTSEETDKKKIIELMNLIRNNAAGVAKISRHFVETINPYYFIYSISKRKNAQETNSITDIAQSYIFEGLSLSNYIRQIYTTKDFIITKSARNNNEWATISILLSQKDIAPLAKYILNLS